MQHFHVVTEAIVLVRDLVGFQKRGKLMTLSPELTGNGYFI